MSPRSRFSDSPFLLSCLPIFFGLLPALSVPVLSVDAFAVDGSGYHSTCEEVRVHVRIVQGSGPVGDKNVKLDQVSLDERISDLRDQLSKLHYKEYRLVAQKSAVVPVTKRRVLNLSDGHKLTLRPLYANEERVGVWLKWIDGSGMEIIDSRVHFKCNEHMLTGLEESTEKGLILAIQVSPIELEQ